MSYGVKRLSRLALNGPILLALFAFAWTAVAGCSDSSDAEDCSVDGCPEGEACLQKKCSAPCTDQDDCPLGRNCAAWGFPDGTSDNYCVTLPYAEDGSTGQFEACSSNDDCDTLRGFQCVGGQCQPRCRSHFDCAGIGRCTTIVDDAGTRTQVCEPVAQPEPAGHFYSSCPNVDECDEDAGFLCVTSGVGDLDSYCTKDCASDDDCATGYFCSKIVRGPPCEDQCGFQGVADDPDCIPSDEIGEGKPFQCGNFGLDRAVCRIREFCTPCETDADCLAVPNTLCARDTGGTKICTQLCDVTTGSCPWGNAGSCVISDDTLNLPTCSHRSGSCTGTGTSCDPCISDADCANGGLCTSSTFTGERWCIDPSVTCDCEGTPASGSCTGGGCPQTQSGLPMICIDDTQSAINHTCYAANTAPNPIVNSPQTGCWDAL